MPPLFPYQAVIPRQQSDRIGEYVSQGRSAPPYNEILDNLLTGYLWGCLLIALFLFVYFAISFCVWAIGTALTAMDTVIDCLRPCDDHPDADLDNAMTAHHLPDKSHTVYLERIVPLSENNRDKAENDL